MTNMKGIGLVLLIGLLGLNVACSNHSSSSSNDAENSARAENNDNKNENPDKHLQKKKKDALLDWELDIIGMIHTTEKPFKQLSKQADVDKGKKVNQDVVKNLLPQVQDAVNQLGQDVDNMKISSDLDNDMQEKLKSATSDLVASYQARANAAKDLKGVTSPETYASKVKQMNEAGKDKFSNLNEIANQAESTLGIKGETDFAREK